MSILRTSIFSILIWSIICVPVEAQNRDESEEPNLKSFEIGGHYTILFQDDFNPANVTFQEFGFSERVTKIRQYESGLGVRLTYNFSRSLAVEGEFNFIPGLPTLDDRSTSGEPVDLSLPGGKKAQFLAGVKYGVRRERWGVFGKVRPGVIRFSAYPKIVGRFVATNPKGGQPLDILIFQTENPATFFNVDIGGVFEYYPSKRTIIRFDVGDTIIRYNAQEPKEINPSFRRHNLQMSLGFGFRF